MLKITMNEPTTIMKDFHRFLTYIIEQPIKLTKTKGNLSKKDLRAMYAMLPNLGLEVGENATQSYYPVINLFMELAQKLDLVRTSTSGLSTVLIVDDEQLEKFEQLTITERYVSLFQCFWFRANWEELQGGLYASTPYNVDFLLEELNEFPVNTKITLAKHPSLKNFLERYGHFLLHFQYFGFWEVELDESVQTKTMVRAKSIKIHPFLKPLIPILVKNYNSSTGLNVETKFGIFDIFLDLNDDDEDFEDEKISSEEFLAALKPHFEKGQLERVLEPKEKIMKSGEYVFKVAISSSCWRQIVLDGSSTLQDLHNWIQRAFSFDDDHLYGFYMDNKPFSQNCYNSPMDRQGPYAHNITIAELYLNEGQQFLYVFDFGHEWHFKIIVEKINEGRQVVFPGIRKEKGKAPKQYPDFDWD